LFRGKLIIDVPQVRRFITLIDALYEKKCKVIISAAAQPAQLFKPEGHHTKQGATASKETFDEVFAFDRTVSRLMEMQSEEYLTTPWEGTAAPDDLRQFIVPPKI
jgi:cell division protein ZapE